MTVNEPQPPAATPRGWYADPNVTGQDRWWDGTEWTKFTHRNTTVRTSMFGAGYGRALWAGANVAAGRSLLIARIAFIALVVVFAVGAFLLHAGSISGQAFAVVTLVLIVAALAASIVGLVLGIIGLRRAKVLGATLAAGWGLGLSILVVLLTGAFLLAIVVRALAG